MATSNEVMTKANKLYNSSRDKRNSESFVGFRDHMDMQLGRLRTSRRGFGERNGPGVEKPAFAGILTKITTAQTRTDALQPQSDSVSKWSTSIDKVVSALDGA